MLNRPIISICIPTFNREIFLKDCLTSILNQLTSKELLELVEIVVVDNDSKDKTEEIVKDFRKKYKNLRYFNSKKNIPLAEGVLQVGKYAYGKYIWFCSDDDEHYASSINTVLKVIRKYSPDVIYCNLDEYSKDMKKISHRNSFEENKDVYLHGRKELFKFLNKKFFYSIDWFTTYYSNLVLKKEVFELSYYLSENYKSKLDLFPQSSAIFYSKKNLNIYVISNRLIKYRGGNLSWGPKQKKEFLSFVAILHNRQYERIRKINSDVISIDFVLKIFIKRLMKNIRLYILLPLFNY